MFLLKLSLRPWRLAPVSHLFSSAAVGFLLLLAGFLYWLQAGLKPVVARLQSEQVITAYLDPSQGLGDEIRITDSIRAALGAQSAPGPAPEVRFVSAKEFVDRIEGSYPELSRELAGLGSEMDSIVPRYVSIAGLLPDSAVESVRSVQGIESAESSKDRYAHIVGAFLALGWVARLLVIGVGVALLTGLVHLSRMNAYLHREVLSLLRLWGAGPGELRAPAMISGALVGAIGGFAAGTAWLTAGQWLTQQLRALSPILKDLPAGGAVIAGFLVLAGVVIGVCAGALGGVAPEPGASASGSSNGSRS